VEVLLAGRDDWISLEEAASLTGRRATPPTAAVYRDDLLALAEELLGSGASRLGTVTAAEGFVPWDLDEAGSIERLASLLEDEGDDWTYAAWFCNTERGDDIADAMAGPPAVDVRLDAARPWVVAALEQGSDLAVGLAPVVQRAATRCEYVGDQPAQRYPIDGVGRGGSAVVARDLLVARLPRLVAAEGTAAGSWHLVVEADLERRGDPHLSEPHLFVRDRVLTWGSLDADADAGARGRLLDRSSGHPTIAYVVTGPLPARGATTSVEEQRSCGAGPGSRRPRTAGASTTRASRSPLVAKRTPPRTRRAAVPGDANAACLVACRLTTSRSSRSEVPAGSSRRVGSVIVVSSSGRSLDRLSDGSGSGRPGR
jgi:hypothetical protein